MGGLVGLMRQINAVKFAVAIVGKCGKDVGAGASVEHAGFHKNTRLGCTDNEIESFKGEVARSPQPLWSAELLQGDAVTIQPGVARRWENLSKDPVQILMVTTR